MLKVGGRGTIEAHSPRLVIPRVHSCAVDDVRGWSCLWAVVFVRGWLCSFTGGCVCSWVVVFVRGWSCLSAGGHVRLREVMSVRRCSCRRSIRRCSCRRVRAQVLMSVRGHSCSCGGGLSLVVVGMDPHSRLHSSVGLDDMANVPHRLAVGKLAGAVAMVSCRGWC